MPERPGPTLVSVVVPVYNDQVNLGQQLQALTRQTYDGPWELIVADNGSRDDSARVAAGWLERVDGRLVDAARRRGPGAARNAGARAAAGDLLAFCDADDVVSPQWLAELVASAPGADLVAGRGERYALNSRLIRACHDTPLPDRPFLGFLPIAPGSNLGIWTSTFWALGGFDERSRTGEDVALSWKAQLEGYRLAVADRAVVHARYPRRLVDVAARYYRYGRGDAWLFSEFGAAGMPRRSRSDALALWRDLLHGLPGMSGSCARRCRWVQLLALSCGRLAGSLRHRVAYT